MKRYNDSKFRILLFVLLLGAVIAAMTDLGHAQTTAPASRQPAVTEVAPATGVFTLIARNMDWVFWTIIACSVIGLALIIQGFAQNRESVLLPKTTTRRIRELIDQRRMRELIQFTEEDDSFVSRALNPALKRLGGDGIKDALETAAAEQTAEQFRKIEYLNIIGNMGPLLGLLGTVLGLIDAFSAMNAAGGDASPAALAGGISKALAHTLLGLMLAIPCLAAFGVLRTIVDRLTVQGSLLAEELLLKITPADTDAAAAPAANSQLASTP